MDRFSVEPLRKDQYKPVSGDQLVGQGFAQEAGERSRLPHTSMWAPSARICADSGSGVIYGKTANSPAPPASPLKSPRWPCAWLQPALAHVNTLLFWSNIDPYGLFGLDMNKRLDLPSSSR
ncbi:hypothetical protein GIY23_12355 [Allosaccharopolyspora coralli]|uniref:Uncharacterized protein n=1 Tax=Allosaccharopolyspora coralli TaxID=2665642 RepID=A0A5Q3Q6E0_9PSEU|nr:hypothetical protein [Allosaccharopolyspora coralli]QGK70211.1 hypothetical protein GIY23_12355 [Allosaccharopolyspora coralli]